MKTRDQVSSGGVVFRRAGGRVEVALVRVGEKRRWQLPKGIVDAGEAPEATALREVREEAGVDAELLAPIDTIDYWYVATERGERVRFHKRVHFYLLAYRSGDVADHDDEVLEARWVEIGEAAGRLAFENERKVVARARELIAARAASAAETDRGEAADPSQESG
jgi:8-oxo-dGTP pyrophosphatase MutT (NUDIX family)